MRSAYAAEDGPSKACQVTEQNSEGNREVVLFGTRTLPRAAVLALGATCRTLRREHAAAISMLEMDIRDLKAEPDPRNPLDKSALEGGRKVFTTTV